ncbi:hypothetical protein KY290_022179 [Solanum tuberosum]|uniref:Uncharacterized protein n=2 Tax=Eukaryota TaxID=2759 RepID=A0ABQ7V3P5_SOLTU|nr:hypothetical protein KY289_021306 [Solanum tuberosum]KAH0758686.1 hypothetical protein KY290_022179 [Solanum tuberosum]|eukprot:CRZ03404.1 hypothetical protein [Spongospora subterranea]
MGRGGARRSSLRNLRWYSALMAERAVLEGSPNAGLVEGPHIAGLGEGPPIAGFVEGPANAEQQNNARLEEILEEMNVIENRIMAKAVVFVCLRKDIDALVEISDKSGGYGGFVKIRPANSVAKTYIRWKVQENNFNSDIPN